MSTLNTHTHTNEVKSFNLRGFNKLKELVLLSQKSAKGIFAMHRNVISLYVTDNKDYFEGTKFIQANKLNPIVKELKAKDFKVFNLLFGTFTLDKVIKASEAKDFLSMMTLYNKSILTFIESSEEEREYILERGEKINSLFNAHKKELISGLDFAKNLVIYFPSLQENLRKGKISTNVAKFLYTNDIESYQALSVSNVYDVEHEELRKDVQKLKGLEGIIKFDELINTNVTTNEALKLIGYEVQKEVATATANNLNA